MEAPSPAQIRDDLRGLFRGELRFDAVTRGLFATDASPFELTPLGVATPHDTEDLQTLVKYAREVHLPMVPRGAGTGLAGESLGAGLIVDLSQHFRGPITVHSGRFTAPVGVTLQTVQAALASTGQRIAIDPANIATMTIGGMAANNASGANAFRRGYARDHLSGLRVVWDTGDAESLGDFAIGPRSALRTTEVHAQTAGLLAAHRELIQLTRPMTRFHRCGYILHDVLSSEGLDLVKLLCGTEGTLAFLTEVSMRTVPLAGGVCYALIGFARVDDAVRAGLGLRNADGLEACDLLDARQLAASRIDPAEGFVAIPPEVGAALWIKLEADSESQALAAGRAAIQSISERTIVLGEPVAHPEGIARLERFRAAAVAGLYARGVGPRPVPLIEDVGVPLEELNRFLTASRELLRQHDFSGSVLVHVLSGQVHTRPFADLNDPGDRSRLWSLAEAVHRLAIALGGTVSTQHGTGLARTPWVEKQSGPLLPIYRELKQIFDPADILNRGKIVGPDPSLPAWPLRRPLPFLQTGPHLPSTQEDGLPRFPLVMTETAAAVATSACNGCGDCRAIRPPTRMCPVFRADPTEASSPRAKANLLRRLLLEDDTEPPTANDIRTVADRCVNCKMCRSECRAGVDIPMLMLAVKAADHARRGLDRSDWFAARVEMLSTLAGNFSFTTNTLLGTMAGRWLLAKLFGLDRQRMLPRFTHRTFFRRAKRAGWTHRPLPGRPPGRRVAYFVDTFANANDPLIAEATVAVLHHHGYEVHVPPRQTASGMAALQQGDAETAREYAERNIRVLADLARDGYQIVVSEPSAMIALQQDYPFLLDDPDVALVAEQAQELTSFLATLLDRGELRTDFRPIPATLGHHVPCHIKALGTPPAGPRLLAQIPGLQVRLIDQSCSGMAGTWGLRETNHDESLRAGEPMLAALGQPGVLFGSTECSACRLQMQHGSRKRTMHPVQYLALAYGFVPELERRLTQPLGRLVTE